MRSRRRVRTAPSSRRGPSLLTRLTIPITEWFVCRASADLSIRIVPDQDLEEVCRDLKHHLESAFEKMRSSNHLEVSSISPSYSASLNFGSGQSHSNSRLYVPQNPSNSLAKVRFAGWMANRNSVFNTLLSRSVAEEWGGIQPLWVREGGSIPSIPFLEQLLDAPAVHFP